MKLLKFQEKSLPLQTNDVQAMLLQSERMSEMNFPVSEDLNFNNFPFGAHHGSN